MEIGFIGLGKLGLPIAEVMGTKHSVHGFDIEPRQSPSIQIASNLADAVKGKKFIFLALPTPHETAYGGHAPVGHLPLKDFNYQAVSLSLHALSELVEDWQTIVLISTVLPGTTRRELRPALKRGQLIYNPYLIAMGTEQKDFLSPEMVILGSEDGSANSISELREFYETLLAPGTRYAEGTWEEAEGIKIFYNTFISAKLGLVNMVQDVAEKLGHMDVDVVTNALSASTKRITSSAYMKAGLGDGGPCHPRDNIALRWLGERLSLGYDLFGAVIQSREAQAENMAKTCLRHGSQVVILGRAFKPAVPYTDGSFSELVGHYVEKLGGRVHYYDPKTGDLDLPPASAELCYLVGHWENWVSEFPFAPGATVIDPWRSSHTLPNVNHYLYGNSRGRTE